MVEELTLLADKRPAKKCLCTCAKNRLKYLPSPALMHRALHECFLPALLGFLSLPVTNKGGTNLPTFS
jgi:hypothetical protein